MTLSEKDLTTKSMIAVAKEYGYTIPREETRYPFTHEEWTTIRRAVRTAKHNVKPVLRLLAAENRTQVLHRIIGFLIASHTGCGIIDVGRSSRSTVEACDHVQRACRSHNELSSQFHFMTTRLTEDMRGIAASRRALMDFEKNTRTPGIRELAIADNGVDFVTRRALHSLLAVFNFYKEGIVLCQKRKMHSQRDARSLQELIPASAYAPMADLSSKFQLVALRVGEVKAMLYDVHMSRLASRSPAHYLHYHFVHRKLATAAKRMQMLAQIVKQTQVLALKTGNNRLARQMERMYYLFHLWANDFRQNCKRYSFLLAERLKRMSPAELTARAEIARTEEELTLRRTLIVKENFSTILLQATQSHESRLLETNEREDIEVVEEGEG